MADQKTSQCQIIIFQCQLLTTTALFLSRLYEQYSVRKNYLSTTHTPLLPRIEGRSQRDLC